MSAKDRHIWWNLMGLDLNADRYIEEMQDWVLATLQQAGIFALPQGEEFRHMVWAHPFADPVKDAMVFKLNPYSEALAKVMRGEVEWIGGYNYAGDPKRPRCGASGYTVFPECYADIDHKAVLVLRSKLHDGARHGETE